MATQRPPFRGFPVISHLILSLIQAIQIQNVHNIIIFSLKILLVSVVFLISTRRHIIGCDSTDPLLLDPISSVNFLPLKDMYLGVNVSREITRLARDINLKPAIKMFLERMQSFLIELSSPLKTRLPLKGGSNANPILSVDKFWGAIGKIKNLEGNLKYVNVSNFAKGLLCLPMSNAACERIFSQIKLIKTKTRNRFINKHVDSILHVIQGISEYGDCVSFQPTKEMIKQMTKAMYKENEE